MVDDMPRAGSHYNLGPSRGPDKIGSAGRVLHVVGLGRLQGRFRWLPRVSRGTAENSVLCSVPGKLPGDPMVVLVGQMGILSAHAWCGTSVKNTMEETIMKRMIYVNHAILHDSIICTFYFNHKTCSVVMK